MEYFNELSALFESEDADLFKPKPKKHLPTPDDHLIAAFGKITLFVRDFGRIPNADADDMNEAVLGTQLNTIRADKKKTESLEAYDELGLLELGKAPDSLDELFADDAGLFSDKTGIFDVSALPERRTVENAGDKATRERAADFDILHKPMFVEQQAQLASGERKLTPFRTVDQLQPDQFYVYDGMMCHVLEFGEREQKAGGYSQQRIHVVFENGTESKMYRRSLAQRLYEGGTVVVDADYAYVEDDGETSGRVYILQSLSDDPKITSIKDLYKIGVTTGSVANRIKNAVKDPTYLMAPVKIVEDYRLTGDYKPQKVEDLIHQIFGQAKIDLSITAPDGTNYTPQEWYSVPLNTIIESVDMIASGEIVNYHYNSATQTLVEN